MATPRSRLNSNVEGDLFVDSSCINCGACRWIAPESFDHADGYSRVYRQPDSSPTVAAALRALVSCPTASIGSISKRSVLDAIASFPYRIDDDVYHCGFHAESSYGAASYLATGTSVGNVLMDSPRFNRPLVRRLEEHGGVDLIVLSHRDDIADAAKFAEHFECERLLHRDDIGPQTRDVERQPSGHDPIELAPDLVFVPVPGHTRGSACLLWKERYLFTGDHLAWHRAQNRLHAFSSACWYDWDTQIESMRRLSQFNFEWVLPGHGSPGQLPRQRMRAAMQDLLVWMEHP